MACLSITRATTLQVQRGRQRPRLERFGAQRNRCAEAPRRPLSAARAGVSGRSRAWATISWRLGSRHTSPVKDESRMGFLGMGFRCVSAVLGSILRCFKHLLAHFSIYFSVFCWFFMVLAPRIDHSSPGWPPSSGPAACPAGISAPPGSPWSLPPGSPPVS